MGQIMIEYSDVKGILISIFLWSSIISWKNDVVGNNDEKSR